MNINQNYSQVVYRGFINNPAIDCKIKIELTIENFNKLINNQIDDRINHLIKLIIDHSSVLTNSKRYRFKKIESNHREQALNLIFKQSFNYAKDSHIKVLDAIQDPCFVFSKRKNFILIKIPHTIASILKSIVFKISAFVGSLFIFTFTGIFFYIKVQQLIRTNLALYFIKKTPIRFVNFINLRVEFIKKNSSNIFAIVVIAYTAITMIKIIAFLVGFHPRVAAFKAKIKAKLETCCNLPLLSKIISIASKILHFLYMALFSILYPDRLLKNFLNHEFNKLVFFMANQNNCLIYNLEKIRDQNNCQRLMIYQNKGLNYWKKIYQNNALTKIE